MSENIIVVSDVHSDVDAFEFVTELIKENNSSLLMIAGDLCPNSFIASALSTLNTPYVCAKGNCDSIWSFKDLGLKLPQRIVYESFFERSIYMYHGDQVEELDLHSGDIVITGHTHVPHLRVDNGVIYLNPGSIAAPRSHYGPTYAIIKKDKIKILNIKGKVIAKYKW